jgi:hypothetical protein
MTVTIQRTSKPLKLLRMTGHACLYLGGCAYLLQQSSAPRLAARRASRA